jgi:cobalt-zinc-cadmium efflux system membrane fusion protein
MNRTRIFTAFLIVASLLFASACGRTLAKETAVSRPLELKTAEVQLRRVSQVLEVPARIQPDPARVVRVFPPAGGRLLRVAVRPGDSVQKGQLVAVLESSDVSQARSDLVKAQAEFDRADRALSRSQLLFEHKVLSEREFEDVKAQQIEASSELGRAKSRLRVLGASEKGSSNEVAVVSPIGGTVLDIGASSGELSKSTDNATPICTIADLGSVWLTGDVYEKDLEVVRLGVPVSVSVSAYPDRHWDGKVANVSDTIDPQTRTAKVRVVLANAKHEFKPEMFATLRMTRPAMEALVIPASAVLHEGGDTTVMVKSGNSYGRRLIAGKPLNANEVVVTSGLQPGDVVVTEGAALLRGSGDE